MVNNYKCRPLSKHLHACYVCQFGEQNIEYLATNCEMSFKSEAVKAMPCQPHHLSFPLRSFGKNAPVNRSFQVSWFNRFPWIHYELDQDAVGMTEASFLNNKQYLENLYNYLENLCNYFCAILCFVNFLKIRVGGTGGLGGGGGGWVWPYH